MIEVTEQETLETLLFYQREHERGFDTTAKQMMYIAIESVEKQVPKKPNEKKHYKYNIMNGRCPVCYAFVNDDMRYCDQCGQKLNWSDSEHE